MKNKNDLSAEEKRLVNQLEAIITIESEKPYTEMDSGLIAECVDWLYEILELPRLTQEQIDENIKKIFCEAEKRKKNTEF
mgnify:CR=1 FL=1